MVCKKSAANSKTTKSCVSGRQTNNSKSSIKPQSTSKTSKKVPSKLSAPVKKENSKARSSNVVKNEHAGTQKKQVVKKAISKTTKNTNNPSSKSAKNAKDVLSSKNIKTSSSKSNKLSNIKKGDSTISKGISKNEQNKNKAIDNIIKSINTSKSSVTSSNNVSKTRKTIKKEQNREIKTLKKLPVSVTSVTLKKSNSSCRKKDKSGDFGLVTPVRTGNPRMSSPNSLSPGNNNGRAISDLIRTPVSIVSSALRKVTNIFKN